MPKVLTKNSTKLEVMQARYHNLVEEINTLKLAYETILAVKAGLLHYAGCARLSNSFGEQETLILQRVKEIDDLLKGLNEEIKEFGTFMEEPPQGGVQ